MLFYWDGWSGCALRAGLPLSQAARRASLSARSSGSSSGYFLIKVAVLSIYEVFFLFGVILDFEDGLGVPFKFGNDV